MHVHCVRAYIYIYIVCCALVLNINKLIICITESAHYSDDPMNTIECHNC